VLLRRLGMKPLAVPVFICGADGNFELPLQTGVGPVLAVGVAARLLVAVSLEPWPVAESGLVERCLRAALALESRRDSYVASRRFSRETQ